MRTLIDFNDGWLFGGGETVRLPHTAVELPYSYFDEKAYQKAFTYTKRFTIDEDAQDREFSLVFDGAMANAKVSLNGKIIGGHKDGYTPFETRLTEYLRAGENLLEVKIDGSENPQIPPFGGMIDYLTYAGIYRDVWLRQTAAVFISNCKIETPGVLEDTKRVAVTVEIENPQSLSISGELRAELVNSAGSTIANAKVAVAGSSAQISFGGLTNIALWDVQNPALYKLRLLLETPIGTDTVETSFGFRSAEFTPEGFKLNGKPLKIVGLNRHQSFPYSGYAMGRAAQERDADILKHELNLDLVRTSHYPQSKWFLNRCDQIGLLVFEEIPGWQHIGDEQWKAESVENVRRMIQRDWNHPSIIIWGVRINESRDDHDFYAQTNRVAHEIDPTRQTGGVRCITDSEMLEDVYTMNDFFLGNEELGGNRPRTPLRPQQEVTGLDHNVPYLVTEYGGHMYPTKSFDQEQRQAEHVLRHLQVLDAAYGDPHLAGCIGWCAFDYNTHADFGSGDRICHHGVMDMFREPKFAAYAYASQTDPKDDIVLKPVTFWTRGDRNIGGVLPLMILTNCDEVELTYGDNAPRRFKPDSTSFPHLPHPPVIIDRDDFSAEELGRWGASWENASFAGYIDGAKVAEEFFVADPVATNLQVEADSHEVNLNEEVRVIVRALDQSGHKMPFYFEPVSIQLSGPGQLFGPNQVPLRGGATGFWLRRTGYGAIEVSVTNARLGTKKITIIDRKRKAA